MYNQYKNNQKKKEDTWTQKQPCLCNSCKEYFNTTQDEKAYATSLKKKQKTLEKIFGEYGEIEPIIGMDNQEHYRPRVLRVFHHEKNGAPMSGHLNDQGRIDKVTQCKMDRKNAQKIIEDIKGLLKSFKIRTYDSRTGYGLLRSILVREGINSGEFMVVLVLSSTIMPSKNNFVKAVRKLHPEITTMIINENYKFGDNQLGDKESNLYGPGFIKDTFAGKVVKIYGRTPYPLNPLQTEMLYKQLVKWAQFKGKETIMDTYCGSGLVSLVAADKVKKVLAVDNKKDNVRYTINNVKANNLKNVDVYHNQIPNFLNQVAGKEDGKIHTLILQHPYMGFEEECKSSVLKVKPENIMIVSKNANILADEIKELIQAGYKVKHIMGVDTVPWTDKIEVCVHLKNK